MPFIIEGISTTYVPPWVNFPSSPEGVSAITFERDDVDSARALGFKKSLELTPSTPSLYGVFQAASGVLGHPKILGTPLTPGIGAEGDSIHIVSEGWRYSCFGITAKVMRALLLGRSESDCSLFALIPASLKYRGFLGSTISDQPIKRVSKDYWSNPIMDGDHLYTNVTVETHSNDTGTSIVDGQYAYSYTPSEGMQPLPLFFGDIEFGVFSSPREPLLITGHVISLPWSKARTPPPRQAPSTGPSSRLSVPNTYHRIVKGLHDSACGVLALLVPWRKVIKSFDMGTFFKAKQVLRDHADFAPVERFRDGLSELLTLPLAFSVYGSTVSTEPAAYRTEPPVTVVREWEAPLPTGTVRVCSDEYTDRAPNGVTFCSVFPYTSNDPSEAPFTRVGSKNVCVTDFGFTKVRHDSLAALLGLAAVYDEALVDRTNIVDYAFALSGLSIHDVMRETPDSRPRPVMEGSAADTGLAITDDVSPICVILETRNEPSDSGRELESLAFERAFNETDAKYTRFVLRPWNGQGSIVPRGDVISLIAASTKGHATDVLFVAPESAGDLGDAGVIIADFAALEAAYSRALDSIL